jgi:hypothetical protein
VFSHVTVTRYGKTETIAACPFTCLWYSVTGASPVTVILIRDKSKTGHGSTVSCLQVVKHCENAAMALAGGR